MNSMMNPPTNKQNYFVFENEEVSEAKEIADKFNSYFVKSVIEINRSIVPEPQPIELTATENESPSLNYFLPIDIDELEKIIFELKNKSSIRSIS